MKLSSIHEPIVEWPNRKPNPGYGLADVGYNHFKYYIGKINSELNKPINIPANYVRLYNTIDQSSRIDDASLQSFLNNYISKKFAGASEFKGYTKLATRMPQSPSGRENYEFNITKELISSLVPGKVEDAQKIYSNANKQLRLYYFGVIRNDPAKAQAEEQKQVQEDINLLFSIINEDSDLYSMRARAFYYNILLTKRFIELLLASFCDYYKARYYPRKRGVSGEDRFAVVFSKTTLKDTPKLLIKLLKEYPEYSIKIIQAASNELRAVIRSTIQDMATLPQESQKRIYVEKIMSVIGSDEYQKLCDYLKVNSSTQGYPEPREADPV